MNIPAVCRVCIAASGQVHDWPKSGTAVCSVLPHKHTNHSSAVATRGSARIPLPLLCPFACPFVCPFECPFWPFAERGPQQWLASLLAVLIVRGRSRAGLCLKKPTGLRWKPTVSTGITAPNTVLSIVEPNAGTYLEHTSLPQSLNVSPAHAKQFWHPVVNNKCRGSDKAHLESLLGESGE